MVGGLVPVVHPHYHVVRIDPGVAAVCGRYIVSAHHELVSAAEECLRLEKSSDGYHYVLEPT